MKVTLLFFASARETAGARETTWELPEGMTAGQLKRELGRRYPAMAALVQVLSVAVGAEYVDDEVVLHEGDQVAIIPPVSGG